MPILFWAAKRGQPITYKQLAEELRRRHREPIMRRMTVYGWPAGKIGHAFDRLSEEMLQRVPPINTIVVNAGTQLPGGGADAFVRRFIRDTSSRRRRMTEKNRDELTRETMLCVWDYTKWDEIAAYFGVYRLPPVSVLIDAQESSEPIDLPPPSKPRGGEESKQHKNLKKWVAENPSFFRHFGRFRSGKNEYLLRSGDSLDAFLENDETQLAVEVKAGNVPDSEVCRGVFQAVKYRATLRAMQLAESKITNAQSVLVLTKKPTSEAGRLADRLRIPILIAPKGAEDSS